MCVLCESLFIDLTFKDWYWGWSLLNWMPKFPFIPLKFYGSRISVIYHLVLY